MAIGLNTLLVIISGIAFIFYGISLFISKKMKNEFINFNLEKYTNLVGGLELLGGLGLLIGLIYNETKGKPIAPTPTIGGVGLISDIDNISDSHSH
mgnify:CR=1 FL=1